MPLQTFAPAPGQSMQQSYGMASPFPTQHMGSGRTPLHPGLRQRQERNFQDIDRLKSDRRSEIRRRCLELTPPIQPSTLDFMDAFNAAIQIARPLTDNDWDVLKTRLVAQREGAEHKERRNTAAAQASQLVTEERQKSNQQRLQAQDTADRNMGWDAETLSGQSTRDCRRLHQSPLGRWSGRQQGLQWKICSRCF